MKKIQEDMLKLEAPQKGYVKDVINGKYELSKSGILINKRTRKVRRGFVDNDGYLRDCFWFEGKIIMKFRHRLVWEAFNGKIPEGLQVNHINEIKTDNRLENLNLMTCKENNNWGTANKRRSKTQRNDKAKSKPVIQKSLDGKIIKIWPSIMEIERELGYNNSHICQCCKGRHKQMYGYIWEYTN